MAASPKAVQTTQQPTPAEVQNATISAQATQLEGLHRLPKGVVIGRCEKSGKRPRQYFAYCMRCSTWLPCKDGEAERHECQGSGFDVKLAAVADEWEPVFKQMRCTEAAGASPFAGAVDLRGSPMREATLELARGYLLCWADEALLPVPLEIFISTPADPSSSEVLVYFHGAAEKHRNAPVDSTTRATISIQCPSHIGRPGAQDRRSCFWFHEGTETEWESFNYKKLSVCKELLVAVSAAVDAALALLGELALRCRDPQSMQVDQGMRPRRVKVLGCSMGAYAALEFAGFRPREVDALACVGGYYDPALQEELAKVTSHIPMLFFHYRRDSSCPVEPIEALIAKRLQYSSAGTETWIQPGSGHCGDERDRVKVLEWLHCNSC